MSEYKQYPPGIGVPQKEVVKPVLGRVITVLGLSASQQKQAFTRTQFYTNLFLNILNSKIMARARLTLDKIEDTRVINFSYSFNRDISASGRPSAVIRGGTVQITIESTKSVFLPTWMTLSQGKTNEGQIEIMDDTDDERPLKTIKFKDAYIVEYGEDFSWQGGENMMETFVISCREITIEGDGGPAVHENEWPPA